MLFRFRAPATANGRCAAVDGVTAGVSRACVRKLRPSPDITIGKSAICNCPKPFPSPALSTVSPLTASADTVTSCRTDSGCNTARNSRVCPTTNSTLANVSFENPTAVTSTTYSPGGSALTRNAPAPPLSARDSAFVVREITFTVAFETGSPCPSTTVPMKWELMLCADNKPTQATLLQSSRIIVLLLLVRFQL